MLYFDDTIATKIYNDSCDMDSCDYKDTKKEEIDLINTALEKIYSYANYNNDFLTLYNALIRIYGE